MVYVIPAHKFEAIPVLTLIEPDAGNMVYTPPTTADDVAPPSQPGTHDGGVVEVIFTVGEAGTVNNTVDVAVQPLALVTVTVYVVPAHKVVALPLLALIVPVAGAILYTFVPTPPAAVNEAVPSQPGLQVGLLEFVKAKVN
jgi:hypothetical protein